jgi:trans-aconitate methyltransferase
MKKQFSIYIAGQFRKPSGLIGKFISKKMQDGNRRDYDWMLSIMNFDNAKNILEIGYGTGVVISEIAHKYPDVQLYGIDFSKVMFSKAKINCLQFLESGKMKLNFGDILEYLPEVKFDVIYGINVIYFWNDLDVYFRKSYQMLNENGLLYLYMADAGCLGKYFVGRTDVFNRRQVEEVLVVFKRCGFSDCKAETANLNGKLCHCFVVKK